jgi:hypothetical protein
MASQSMHFYLNWAKERIDEMDAMLASLEQNAGRVQADSSVKADQLMADLRKKRHEFQDAIKKQTEAGEVAWSHAKAQLETQWKAFETEVRKYVETFGKQIGQQQLLSLTFSRRPLKRWLPHLPDLKSLNVWSVLKSSFGPLERDALHRRSFLTFFACQRGAHRPHFSSFPNRAAMIFRRRSPSLAFRV